MEIGCSRGARTFRRGVIGGGGLLGGGGEGGQEINTVCERGYGEAMSDGTGAVFAGAVGGLRAKVARGLHWESIT